MNIVSRRDLRPGALLAGKFAKAGFGAIFLAAIMVGSGSAVAQPADMPRADLVEQLGAQYAEAQAAIGITDEGGVVEIFTAADGTTWTLVLTKPDGTSRIVAAGETWIKR